MKIEYIKFPYIFTDTGERINLLDVEGVAKVGYELETVENGKYKIVASTSDSECVGGVCPIK